MKISMIGEIRFLKRDGEGSFVAIPEDDFVGGPFLGGYSFVIGQKVVPFDFSGWSASFNDKGNFEFQTGYGFTKDFGLDECFDEDYEKLGLKREDVSAQYLASACGIDEFFVDFELSSPDGIVEGEVGDNFNKDSQFKCEIISLGFEDIDTGVVYDVKPGVLKAFNKGERLVVRSLNEEDFDIVKALDERSGNSLADMMDCDDYGFGLFKDDVLIGYCSVGGADVYEDDIENYPGYTDDSLLLGDVFVVPEEAGKGFGSILVDEAIKLATENNKELVFCPLLDNNLVNFYEKLGFKVIDGEGYFMVRDERMPELGKSMDEALWFMKTDKALVPFDIKDFKRVDCLNLVFDETNPRLGVDSYLEASFAGHSFSKEEALSRFMGYDEPGEKYMVNGITVEEYFFGKHGVLFEKRCLDEILEEAEGRSKDFDDTLINPPVIEIEIER